TVGRSWRRGAQEARFELLAVGAVVDPFAGGGDPLARRNGCGMANHGHDVTMPARAGAQNAKTILCVVVGDALDDARQHFLVWWFRLPIHVGLTGRVPATGGRSYSRFCRDIPLLGRFRNFLAVSERHLQIFRPRSVGPDFSRARLSDGVPCQCRLASPSHSATLESSARWTQQCTLNH